MSTAWKSVTDNFRRFRQPYLLVLLISALNFHVWYDLLIDWWTDPNYSHGFLVIPIAIWVIYNRRSELKPNARLDRLGIVIFVVGSIGMVLGIAAAEFFVTRLSLVLQLTGIGFAWLGRENFRKIWFAFFFLLFMIPIPGVIYYQATLPMQLLASKVTAVLLDILGVPVVRQGNIIRLPEYSLEVIEACSGLRSLVSLLALGSLYAWLYMKGKLRSVALVLFTLPIAIAANIVRILITALGAYAISRQLADTFLHEISGLMVFISALIMMLITGAILKWTEKFSS